MTAILYGIRNCDTVRTARRWLDDAGVVYRFHDLRSDGVDAALVAPWLQEAGWQAVINRRSSTWKALPKDARESMDEDRALAAILEAPTLVKRPVLADDGLLEIGFSAARYATIFGGRGKGRETAGRAQR
jgi:Spx/MgsR family transcriptional regulator